VPMCIQTAVEHKEMTSEAFLNTGRLLIVPHLKHFVQPGYDIKNSMSMCLTCILESPGSNLSWDTDNAEVFHGYP
jgi:hypothetical protein